MELGTFGAVFTFAIQLEEKTKQIYEDAIGAIESNKCNYVLSTLQVGIKKRIRKLERARQEFVREAILVHVSGLNKNDYTIDLALIDTNFS